MHSPYPGVRLPVGFEMTIDPDEIAIELIKRGFFDEIKPDLSVVKNAEAEESPLSEPKKMKKHRGAD